MTDECKRNPNAVVARRCKVCLKEDDEENNVKLKVCTACYSVNYCSKECQKADWKDHKKLCKKVYSINFDPSKHEKRSSEEQERRRRGTSANDPSRLNREAEKIAVEARKLKRSAQYDQAIVMYTRAIELDPFNHEYFHHRAETYSMAELHPLAKTDALCALDLMCREEDRDECFCLAFLTLIRAYIDMHDLEMANNYIDTALRVVPVSDPSHHFVLGYKQWLESQDPNLCNWSIRPVYDDGDEILFAYSDGLHNRFHQQELLVVDIPTAADKKGDPTWFARELIKYVALEKMGSKPLALGDVFMMKKTGHWISAIPVTHKEDRKAIDRSLTCRGKLLSNLVVLKVDKPDEKPCPFSEAQAKAYIAAIAKNASKCQALYNRGAKLVKDDVLLAIQNLKDTEETKPATNEATPPKKSGWTNNNKKGNKKKSQMK